LPGSLEVNPSSTYPYFIILPLLKKKHSVVLLRGLLVNDYLPS
jgi:hypothetical protein